MTTATFKIGDFSRLCRVPVSALRYYADIGLLEPAQIDGDTGYRYYSLDQLPHLNRILALRDLGFSLEQISRLLTDNVSIEQLQGMFLLRQAEIEQTIAAGEARLRQVSARLRQIAAEGQMVDADVIIKPVEPLRVLSLRAVACAPDDVATLLRKAAQAFMGHGLQPAAPPLTIFHDAEFAASDLDVEVAFPVGPAAPQTIPLMDGRRLQVRELPAVKQMAAVLHTGDYDTLEDTYAAIARWIEDNGYQPSGPVRELYIRPHSDTDNEPGMTEIQFPVTRA